MDNIDEIIDLMLEGEYDVPKVEVLSDIDMFLTDITEFNIK